MDLRLALATMLTLAAAGLGGCAQEKAPPAPSTSHASLADEPNKPANAAPQQQGAPVVVQTQNGQVVIFQPGCIAAARPQGAALIDDDDLDDLAQPVGDDKFLSDNDFPSGDEGPTGPSPVASPSFDSDYSPKPSDASDAQAAAQAATTQSQAASTCAPMPAQG